MLHTQKWQLQTDTSAIRWCVMHESAGRHGQESFSITLHHSQEASGEPEKKKTLKPHHTFNKRYQISHTVSLQIYYHKMESHGDESEHEIEINK